ncbi:hypothetical protein ACJX0J_020268, partial [Zea mays]
GDPEGRLLPLPRARGPVPRLHQPIHRRLRRHADRLLADPRPRQGMVAVHRGRHHVLLLLHHRHLARCCSDCRTRRTEGEPRRRHRCWRQGHHDAEGVAQPAGFWEHRVRVRFLYHPARDT